MKNVYLTGLLLSAAWFFPTLTHANVTQTTNTKIVLGRFSDAQSKNFPLLGVSADGNKWTYPTSIVTTRPYPDNADYFNMSDAACSQSFCAAVGVYSTNQQRKPLLAISKDNGLAWSYLSVMPNTFVQAELDQVKCNTSTCVAAGAGTTQDDNYLPVLMTSSDGGSWISPAIANLPHDLTAFGMFSAATCDDRGCFAAGKFEKAKQGFPYYPLIAVSADKGKSWSYSSDILNKTPAVSSFSDYYDFNLTNISCNDTTCVLGGTYFNSKEAYLPLIAVSNDKGVTWNYPKSVFSNMPGGVHQAEINKVACDQKSCIAVGKSTAPYLAVSSDRGATWSYPASITTELPKDYAADGELEDVSCNSHVCVAVGKYKSKNLYAYAQPLLAVSYDHGNKWSYVTNISAPSSIFLLHNASCNEEYCAVTGTWYTSWLYPMSKPLLLNSRDNGVTWSAPVSVSANLPANLALGEFTSIN